MFEQRELYLEGDDGLALVTVTDIQVEGTAERVAQVLADHFKTAHPEVRKDAQM